MSQLLVEQFKDNNNYTVPYSELAMHLKIAGHHITYAHVDGRTATVCVDGKSVHHTGLISELLPFELRDKIEGDES